MSAVKDVAVVDAELERLPLHEALEQLVRMIETRSAHGVLASVLLYDRDAGRLRHGAAPSLPGAYNRAIDGIAVGPLVGSCGTAAFTGEIVMVSDISVDPRWREYKAIAEQHQLRACWSKPILSKDCQVLGTFALYHRVPTVPDERDLAIVDVLARTAARLIERDRAARTSVAE